LTLGHRQIRGCNMTLVSSLHPVLLKLGGIRYILSFDSVPDAGRHGLEKTGTVSPVSWSAPASRSTTETLHVYEYRDRIARAFVVPRARPVRSADERLSILKDPDFDPLGTCLVEDTEGLDPVRPVDGSTPAAGGTTATAEIVIYDPEHVTIRARTDGHAILVLTDAYERGWRATVDGIPRRVLRVDHCFRGIPLAPGRHVVEFVYDPLSFRVGAGLTMLGLFASFALLASRHVIRPTACRPSP
jgi:hypothetical protein